MIRRSPQQSALTAVLNALVPYSRDNLLLSFKPNKFFNELEKNSKYKQSTLKNAYWRAGQRGFIKFENKNPSLTDAGREKINDYEPKYLGRNASLVLIFDIPEEKRKARQQLRELIKSWDFVQIQKSVWASDKDYRELLIDVVSELRLAGCVEIYEGVRLFPKRTQ